MYSGGCGGGGKVLFSSRIPFFFLPPLFLSFCPVVGCGVDADTASGTNPSARSAAPSLLCFAVADCFHASSRRQGGGRRYLDEGAIGESDDGRRGGCWQ